MLPLFYLHHLTWNHYIFGVFDRMEPLILEKLIKLTNSPKTIFDILWELNDNMQNAISFKSLNFSCFANMWRWHKSSLYASLQVWAWKPKILKSKRKLWKTQFKVSRAVWPSDLELHTYKTRTPCSHTNSNLWGTPHMDINKIGS